MRAHKTIQMVEIALMSAVMCIISPITIPIPASPVPLSLATFVVYLVAAVLGVRKGVFSVLVYLLLGLAGLPVFSGFSGGIGVLLGPTGGYLLGYVPCVVLAGWLMEQRIPEKDCGKNNGKQRKKNCHWKRRLWDAAAMLIGTLACYLFGTVWFLRVMDGYTIVQAVFICVTPYLFFDVVKIMLAAYLAMPIKKRLRRI